MIYSKVYAALQPLFSLLEKLSQLSPSKRKTLVSECAADGRLFNETLCGVLAFADANA